MTFAEKVISFLETLEYNGSLPKDIVVMNPYRENPDILPAVRQFYKMFYSDSNMRHIILGINPGRYGAGSTGIPFTDTIRLHDILGISIPGVHTFELSSSFIYEMINAFGGPESFYSRFFITAISPLGFTTEGKRGKQVNYNYYLSCTSSFIRATLEKQLGFGIHRNKCFCLGTGKNYRYLSELNGRYGYFDEIIPIEHPRYIMQYKTRTKELYIKRYIEEFRKV